LNFHVSKKEGPDIKNMLKKIYFHFLNHIRDLKIFTMETITLMKVKIQN